MRIAAIADLHLGFRAGTATEGGRNVREMDVERALARVVHGIIEAKPDLVTIAGDVFHHPRVSDFARLAFLEAVRALLALGIPVVIAQGNHDAGRTADVLTPIALGEAMSGPGVLYVVTQPERLRFRTLGQEVAVAVFPFTTRVGDGAPYRLEPDPDADVNVLLVHAAVRGSAEGDTLPRFYGTGQALDMGYEADRWDCIAVGDYHEFTRLHPTALAFYSGSIERTSSNIWAEKQQKGWVLADTAARTLEFMEIPTRDVVDYEYRDIVSFGVDVDAAGLNDALQQLLDSIEDGLQGSIVRLKVREFPRAEREHIDWTLVRKLKALTCHFQLDLEYQPMEAADLGDRRERAHALSLAEEFAAFFANDPDEVRALARRAMELEQDAVETVEVAA